MTEERFLGRRFDGGKSPLGRTPSIENLPGLEVALKSGYKDDTIIMPDGQLTTVDTASKVLEQEFGITVGEYAKLRVNEQNKIIRKIEHRIREIDARMSKDFVSTLNGRPGGQDERTDLHERLIAWSRGTLTLERPQASSLHHLVNYDKTCGDRKSFLSNTDDMQNIIVEHEWARAMPPTMLGEWRVPFAECCWEFRVSGVRVLAFTFAEDVEHLKMVMVYGKDRVWVSDDYIYDLSNDGLKGKPHELLARYGDTIEFRRVAELIRANIRASCIMLEANNIVERETREPSEALVAKARREGMSPPKKHQVIRLLNMERRSAYRSHMGAGSSGTKQGGHWRRGTWVHYDDQDSGKVQYMNDGGFVVSKTWRGWHFAGDPSRMIDKEYRL